MHNIIENVIEFEYICMKKNVMLHLYELNMSGQFECKSKSDIYIIHLYSSAYTLYNRI